MSRGFNLWDTACAYGMGASEKTLAAFIRGLPRETFLVSDKFTPQCVADRLGLDTIRFWEKEMK